MKLLPYLKGNKVVIFHIAKLHGLNVKTLQDAELYDISGMPYVKMVSLIRMLDLDMMVFLSFRSLLELVLQRICVSNGIKQVYLEHGFFSDDTLRFRTNKLKKERGIVIKRQKFFLYLSVEHILRSDNRVKELLMFYRIYVKGDFYLSPHEHYYLFSERSFDMISKVYRLEKDNNVEFVGYPIFLDDQQKELSKMGISTDGGVLYVHQPLVSDGIAKISFNDEKSYLINLARNLGNRYGKFTILLHPRAVLQEYKDRYADTSIEIIQSPNDYRCFADKSLIIGHYSTALLYGLYFDKLTIVTDYPTVEIADNFKNLFVYCKDIAHLPEMTNASVGAKRKEYIIGKHNTFEYIAKALLNKK